MAIIELPCRSDHPHYSFHTDLDGTRYYFEFRWNARAEAWFMDIGLSPELMIRSGIRVITGFPLLARVRDERRPTGALMAFDTTSQDREAGETDLGSSILMLYFDAAEMEALG